MVRILKKNNKKLKNLLCFIGFVSKKKFPFFIFNLYVDEHHIAGVTDLGKEAHSSEFEILHSDVP